MTAPLFDLASERWKNEIDRFADRGRGFVAEDIERPAASALDLGSGSIPLEVQQPQVPTDDQLDAPSCVAAATADAIMTKRLIDGDTDPARPSKSWLWRHGKADRDASTGMPLSAAIGVANDLGAPPESTWPYTTDPTEPPPFEAMAAAFPMRGKLQAHLLLSLADVCRALAQGETLIVAFRSLFGAPHCVRITGYSLIRGTITIKNSWGGGFADNGYAELDASVVESDDCMGVWAITKAPEDA